jgi:hypothetical protein
MNLGIIAPDPAESGSFYRAWGPLGLLSRSHNVRLIESPSWNWKTVIQCDCVFMHQAWNNAHRRIAECCAALNVPLWLDHDDNLLAIPVENAYFDEFDKARADISRIAALANVLTVSTSGLANVYGKEANIIPNGWNDRIFNQNIWRFAEEPRRKVISWRGAAAHDADLVFVLPAIERLAKEFPEWRWDFFGYPHWAVQRIMARAQCRRHPFDPDLFAFMRDFGQTCPSIHIVALEDTPFNRAKSNCGWLEATWAGAVVLGPNWDEWHRPGIHNYKDAAEFEERLRQLIQATDDDRREDVARSREYIAQNLTLDRVNQLRVQVLGVILAANRNGSVPQRTGVLTPCTR